MKGTTILTAILFTGTALFGQVKSKTKPFSIKGKITNCPESHMTISFRDENEQLLIDTIHLDQDGKFYLKTFKVQ